MTSEQKPITTRNLIEGGLGPLRRFTGLFASMPTQEQTYGEGEDARVSTRINLNYGDIDVQESVEPYHFPTVTITISQSNKKKSRWGVFGGSFNDVVDQQYSADQLDQGNPNYVPPKDRMDIEKCIGKRMGLVMADGEDGRPKPPILWNGRAGEDGKGADVPTPTWTVYSVEGVGVVGGGQNPMDLAMDMLDGATLAEFNAKAMANPVVRGDVELLQAISQPPSAPGSFANALVTAGKFTKDDQEVFHKK